jgi:hypothetical protein
MSTMFDSIHTETKKCGCVISSNLDIIENIITDTYITLCESCFQKCNNKKDYTYNKHKSVYYLNSMISKNSLTQNIKKSASLIHIHDDSDSPIDNSNIIQFGKYKYKTFDYVYNNDKLYCYNLSYWNNNIHNKNDNLFNFINFIKTSINI